MNPVSDIPNIKKLTIIYRFEPGGLGPNGKQQINEFCQFAEDKFRQLDSLFLIWDIQPRSDKRLPEIQFQFMRKNISHQQATIYLEKIGKNITQFSNEIDDEMANYIDMFLSR